MKANELMIGDWVLINGTVCKIQAVDGVDDEIIADNKLYTLAEDRYHSEDKMNGVPLTPEILGRNGFERCVSHVLYNDTIRKLICNSKQFAHKELGNLRIEDKRPCYGWSLTAPLFGDTEHYAIHHIRFVHELQHALRLCGIEKEIEL